MGTKLFDLQTTGEGPTCSSALFVLSKMASSELEALASIIEDARSKGRKESCARVRMETLMDAFDPKGRK